MADDPMYTHEQHESLLTAAIDKAVNVAQEESDKALLALTDEVEQAKTLISEKDATIEELKSKIADIEATAELEKIGNERAGKVRAVAKFSEEQITERQEFWAKLEEGDFDKLLADYGSISSGPPATSFDGTRETAGDDSDGSERSVISRFFDEVRN